MGFYDLKQFICWREVPDPNGGKPRKVPTDPTTGRNIDPHTPSRWMMYQDALTAAKAKGYMVGIVLTAGDPYFLFDVDNCVSGGEWHPGALDIVARFPNAMIEVSVSGTGLHVIGRCDAAALGPRSHKFWHQDVQCEFYSDKRFIALGIEGTQRGDPEGECTAALGAVVPVATMPKITAAALTAGPVPEYTGPTDDTDLTKALLLSKGSTASMFGSKASARQLWERDVVALAQHFPPINTDDPFDLSSADMALMMHLAFWTGKDAARMDRLFRMSGLMREKYSTRPEYATATVGKAVSGCKGVYDKVVEVLPAENHSVDPVMMDGNTQLTHFEGCVYVWGQERIMVRGGHLLKQSQFRALYGGYSFTMETSQAKPTYNAYEAFTESRWHTFPKVRRTRFLPAEPHGKIIEDDDGNGVNIYVQPNIRMLRGDTSMFDDFFCKFLPVERDRQILMSWMAAVIQYPGKKFLWVPVIQGTEGNGKSMLGDILTYAVGEKYCWSPDSSKLDRQFNTFLENRRLITVEEMHMFHKNQIADIIKALITNSRQEVEGKGTNADMIADYCANWLFTTNHRDAIVKGPNDRRFSVFYTAQQSVKDMIDVGWWETDYFVKLYDWLRADGYALMAGYLMDYKIQAEFNPAEGCVTAPKTSSHNEVIAESRTSAEQHIVEAVDSGMIGFRGGWISTWAASKLLDDVRMHKSGAAIGNLLSRLGYEKVRRSPSHVVAEGNSKPVLYAKPGTVTDFYVSQGYSDVGFVEVEQKNPPSKSA